MRLWKRLEEIICSQLDTKIILTLNTKTMLIEAFYYPLPSAEEAASCSQKDGAGVSMDIGRSVK